MNGPEVGGENAAPTATAQSLPPLATIPGWRGWFARRCPACGEVFRNGIWQFTGYSMHYATTHLGIRLWRSL